MVVKSTEVVVVGAVVVIDAGVVIAGTLEETAKDLVVVVVYTGVDLLLLF